MTGGRGGCTVHQSKLDKYALLKEVPEVGASLESTTTTPDCPLPEVGSLTLQDIIVAIQGVRTSLETRIDLVSTEVSLLRTDLRNMATQVKDVEESAAALQGDTKTLQTQVEKLQALATILQARLEDYEGRSQ
ncbi:hypothetical protein NDU88_000216 [Pleurodeles waltl]|uniref:Uncharacterized protein n=1 Tax=Pleurodeles waltl TaxID=8319 RepID=A0AAV7S3Y1_PLEWA|nr:hypothetical protein NDU88_000216 [Pleurodeles waltl]